MLDAGDVRHRWMAAGRDQDIFGGVAPPADFDGVRVDQDPAALDDLDAAVPQHVDVDLLEPVELLVFGGDQGRPIEGRWRHVPAEARRIGEGVRELRPVDQQLFRHAAAQHAGAADPALFDNRDPGAIAAGAAGAGDAAGAGTDRDHVEIIARHAGSAP